LNLINAMSILFVCLDFDMSLTGKSIGYGTITLIKSQIHYPLEFRSSQCLSNENFFTILTLTYKDNSHNHDIYIQIIEWPSVTFSNFQWPSMTFSKLSVTFSNLQWPSVTFSDLQWPSVTFSDLQWPSVTKILMQCFTSSGAKVKRALQAMLVTYKYVQSRLGVRKVIH